MQTTQTVQEIQQIPASAAVYFGVAVFFTLLLPVILLVVYAVKKKLRPLPFLAGTLAFFVSQLLLRIPLLNLLSQQMDLEGFAAANALLYTVLLSFSAGLFEESGRLAGVKLLKERRSFSDMISFGLGHACCEMFLLVGLSNMGNLAVSLILGDQTLAEQFTAAMPPDQIAEMYQQFANLQLLDLAMAILERVSAICYHLFASCLIFQAVNLKKYWYYPLAILAHTLFNSLTYLARLGLPLLALEMIWLVLGAAGLCYVLRQKADWPVAEAVAQKRLPTRRLR